jgi:hypothetical protein
VKTPSQFRPPPARLAANADAQSFEDGQQKQTFAIRGHTADLANDVEDGEEEAPK